MRLACLSVPLFPLAARLRAEPELGAEACAILEGQGPQARIVAATRRARRAGLRRGHTLTQARLLLPALVTRARDPECERSAADALIEVAESFSPRVETSGLGLVHLEIGGDPRFGTENEVAEALAREAERAGLPAGVGIAGTRLAAAIAAGLRDGPHVVAPAHEVDFLAPLPLTRLAPALAVATSLDRWGIRTIGDLARLSAAEVTSRLGSEGRRLHQAARGIDPTPLAPRRLREAFREGMSLDWPIATLEPLLFLVRPALERLVARLARWDLGVAVLGIALALDPDGAANRSIRLPAPTRDPKTLLTLFRLELEREPPAAPVVGFALSAETDRPRAAQLGLFGPAELSPEKLATTLARLFALLGPERLGTPTPVDGHLPEQAELAAFTPPPAPLIPPPRTTSQGHLAIRAIRPPIAVEVQIDERGRPRHLKPHHADRRPQVEGDVHIASGPWAIEEGWWRPDPVQRRYWDIELRRGGIWRLYEEPMASAWWVDGVYD
jgi:protein ImuB